MGKLWRSIMNLSIRNKFIILISITITTLFIALTAILFYLSSEYAQKQLIDSKMQNINQVRSTIKSVQKSIETMSLNISITPEIQRMLKSNSDYKIPLSVIRTTIVYPGVTSIVFYNLEGQVLDFMSADMSTNPVSQSIEGSAFSHLVTGERLYEWSFVDKGQTSYMLKDNSPKMCLWRLIKNTNNMAPLGIVCITIDTRGLVNASTDYDYKQEMLLLLDQDGSEMLKKANIKDLQMTSLLKQTPQESGHFVTTSRTHTMQVVYAQVPDTHFTLMVLYPPTDLRFNFQDFWIYIFMAVFLFVVFLFFLMLFISTMITKPIKILTNSMLQFSKGDFESNVSVGFDDEIGTLGRVFNEMVYENKKLIEQTYTLQIKEKEAELSAIQAQINPHFFYNLMNVIQWNCLKTGDAETADIAYAIGKLFRFTLSHKKPIISVSDEVELVVYYLKLQKVRYKARLNYTVSIDERTNHMGILKLLIQPLVENTLIHSVENTTKTVNLAVSIGLSEDKKNLKIEVVDDGIGIAPQVLALLPDKLPEDLQKTSNRFALKNISERLTLNFGSHHTFEIISKQGHGTHVTIEIPVIMEES